MTSQTLTRSTTAAITRSTKVIWALALAILLAVTAVVVLVVATSGSDTASKVPGPISGASTSAPLVDACRPTRQLHPC